MSSSPAQILPLLIPLLPSHPSLLPLLQSHQPFLNPSHLLHNSSPSSSDILPSSSSSSSDLTKFFNRLSSFVLVPASSGGRSDTNPTTNINGSGNGTGSGKSKEDWARRVDAWRVAEVCVRMDGREGWVLGGWGKGWVLNLLGYLNNTQSPPSLTHLPPLISLLTTLLTHSALSPTFQREVANVNLVRVSQGVVMGGLRRGLEQGDERVILTALTSLPHLISLSPTPHRPLLPTLLPLLHILLLSHPTTSPTTLTKPTATLLATLHTLSGKVAAGQTFNGDMKGAVREGMGCLDGMFGELWVGGKGEGSAGGTTNGAGDWRNSISASQPIEPFNLGRVPLPAAGPGQIKGSTTPSSGETNIAEGGYLRDTQKALDKRLRGWLRVLGGWSEMILALLRFKTERNVMLPVGSIIALGMRCLSINYDTAMLESVDSETRAVALALLPKVWGIGLRLLGAVVVAAEDHVLPHAGPILSKTIALLEHLPASASSSRLILLKFHHTLLFRLRLDPSSSSFQTRLLKSCLSEISAVLDTKTPRIVETQTNGEGMGKRAKKRARGAGEDLVVAGMEGRVGRGLGRLQGEVVLATMKLARLLHHHVSLPPHLLSLSIKVHLSLSYQFPNKTPSAISQEDPSLHHRLSATVNKTLEDALLIENGGVQEGWTGLVAAHPAMRHSDILPVIMHPSAPPLIRPLPQVSTFTFYDVDSEEEAILREELGLRLASEADDAANTLSEGAVADASERPTKRQATQAAVEAKQAATAVPMPVLTQSQALPSNIFGSNTASTSKSTVQEGSGQAIAIGTLEEEERLPVSVQMNVAETETAPVIQPVASTSTAQPTEATSAFDAQEATAAFTEPRALVTERAASTIAPQSVTGAAKGVPFEERKEGVRYDSEGEEMPEINMDSDTDDDEDDDME